MKKIYLKISLLLVMLVTPFCVSASELDLSKYPTELLEEALASEQIDITGDELDKYNEGDSSDKVKIYVFRKNGCGNCKNFLNYVKTVLIPNYGGKFEIVSFELSGEPRNFTPLNTIAEFFNNRPLNDLYTTPYIAIGNKTFTGFIDAEKQKQIEEIISSQTTFDVVEKINSGFLNINDTVKKEFMDSNVGIKLSSDKDLDVSYILKVIEGTHKDLVLDNYTFISTYDISMYDNKNGVVSLNNGLFTISIPVTNEYDNYKVAYIKDGQITEVLDATYENGYVVFTTTHLSEYAIYGSKKEVSNAASSINIEEKNPNTFDSIVAYQIMFVAGCIFLALSLNLYRKQKCK